MKHISACLLMMLTAFQVLAFTSSVISTEEEKTISAFIAEDGTRKSAKEVRQARKIIVESNTGEEASIAVVYTLEGVRGGNDWIQYIAVFTRNKKTLHAIGPIRIGGKGLRSVEFKTYEKGIIELLTLNYLPSDALCCPSVPGFTHVIIGAQGLEEADTRINCDVKVMNKHK